MQLQRPRGPHSPKPSKCPTGRNDPHPARDLEALTGDSGRGHASQCAEVALAYRKDPTIDFPSKRAGPVAQRGTPQSLAREGPLTAELFRPRVLDPFHMFLRRSEWVKTQSLIGIAFLGSGLHSTSTHEQPYESCIRVQAELGKSCAHS